MVNDVFAPIALFVYNRPDLLQALLTSLQANPEAAQSDLHIFSDGLKETPAPTLEGREGFAEVRRMIKSVTGFRSVNLHLATQNKGLASSIIEGVTEMVVKHERVVVLEDDLVLSKDFLRLMNRGLEIYRDNPQVASIHGYNYPGTEKLNLPEVFFYRGADCWGWATWRRAWACFEPDASALFAELNRRRLVKEFNPGRGGIFMNLLKDQIQGKVASWAICWHASAFLRNMYTLYPKVSLVHNNGFDGRGTHCQISEEYKNDKLGTCPDISAFPQKVKASQTYKRFLCKKWNGKNSEYFWKKFRQMVTSIISLLRKVVRKLRKYKENDFRTSASFIPEANRLDWFGNYSSWEEASVLCQGYDDEAIVSKVLESTLAVKEGRAVFERDSVLFDRIIYSWPVTAYLLRTALEKNRLRILDFGGALGTHYFQNRWFLAAVKNLSWVVVELPKMVRYGRQNIAHDALAFASSLEEAYLQGPVDVVLISGVLPYLKEPLAILADLQDRKPPLIILDRTFISLERRLCVQVIPPSIYKASYPCWFLTEKEIMQALYPYYNCEEKFEALDGRFCEGVETFGYVFRLKE